jgi:hypothetical protein
VTSDERITWEERSAILEYCHGLPRAEAERLAHLYVQEQKVSSPVMPSKEVPKQEVSNSRMRQPLLPGVASMPAAVKEHLQRLYGNW